jgi:hypothetical protein
MYKLHDFPGMIRNMHTMADFPETDGCAEYIKYKEWLADGNTPLPPDSKSPLQEIVQIESKNPVTHRMLRELTLSVAQIAAAITGKAPEENPAVRDILAIETQIAVLRQQAKDQGLIP